MPIKRFLIRLLDWAKRRLDDRPPRPLQYPRPSSGPYAPWDSAADKDYGLTGRYFPSCRDIDIHEECFPAPTRES